MSEKELRLGRHVIVDAWGASREALDDLDLVRSVAIKAVEASGATLIDINAHKFSPQGVTAVATLAESHLALHTWPEHGFFGLDMFLCGKTAPERAVEVACELLGASDRQVREVSRSMPVRLPRCLASCSGRDLL